MSYERFIVLAVMGVCLSLGASFALGELTPKQKKLITANNCSYPQQFVAGNQDCCVNKKSP